VRGLGTAFARLGAISSWSRGAAGDREIGEAGAFGRALAD